MSEAVVQLFGWRRPFLTASEPVPVVMWDQETGRLMTGEHGPVTVSVSTHDGYYLRTRSSWKRLLTRALSPDLVAAYDQWKTRETGWYERLGITVPDSGPRHRRKSGAMARETCRRGHPYRLYGRLDKVRGERHCRACARER